MKTYTVTEYAKLAGKTVTAIYKGKRYKQFLTVINGVKSIAIPDDIDPLTLGEPVQTLNTVENRSKPFKTPVEAASDPVELVELRAQVEGLSADKRELQAQLDGLKGKLEEKDKYIASLEQEKVFLQGQCQQWMEQARQVTLRLPAPKKTLGERVKAALGIRPKEQ